MQRNYVEFHFDYSTPSYSDFNNLILGLKNKYNLRLAELKIMRDNLMQNFSLKKTAELMNQHKILINEIILQIIEPYKPLLKNWPIGIFWTGSFSRNSNRLSSDYDLGFTYPSHLKSEILPIEEQIYLAISEILGKPRDLIHSAIASHLKKNDENQSEQINRLFYKMCWIKDNGAMKEYPISPGLEPLMNRIHDSDRSPEVFAEHLRTLITPKLCLYWTGDFEAVYGEHIVTSLFSEVDEKEIALSKINNFKKDFNSLIENQRTLLNELTSNLQESNLSKVKEIKIKYKKNPLEAIFSVLALIRRRQMWYGINPGPVKIDKYFLSENIKRILEEELFTKLFNKIYKTFWEIIRLEAIFEKRGIRFGVHSTQSIDNAFYDLYKLECPDIELDFQINHKSSLKELYEILEEVLSKIKIGEEK